MRFLVIENDAAQAHQIKKALIEQGYIVDVVIDGEQGWAYVEAFTYDLLLVNAHLPKLNGVDLCQRIREQGYSVPILLLTVQNSSIDHVACLEAGIDDHLIKPFSPRELFARIRALLRSPRQANAPLLKWNSLHLDPISREVTYQQHPLSLSPKEYSLLELFLRNPKRVLTQTAILEHLWSFESQPNEHTVRAHIKRLRRKLKTVNADKIIETVYGVGYRLKPLSQSQSQAPLPLSSSALSVHSVQKSPEAIGSASNATASIATQSTLNSSSVMNLAASWERFKTLIFNRIQTLEQTITTDPIPDLTPELCQNAAMQAHKLAGSLGIFGFKSGYRLAQQIEQWFIEAPQDPQNQTSIEILKTFIAQLHQELQQPLNWLEEKTPRAEDQNFIANRQIPTPQKTQYRVLVIDDDLELTEQLQRAAINWNIQLDVITQLEKARLILQETPPDLVLLDLVFPDHQDGGFVLLEELQHKFSELPVLVWTVRDDMSDRATVARLGGNAFLSKSASCDQVLTTIKDILQSTPTASTQILAVDDDPVTLNRLLELLPSYGLEVTPLDDPRLFWETLEKTAPELLILDLEMPFFNGVELCQTVRTDRSWNALPILFLSARKEPQTIQDIYQAGADDYISKPFAEAELITRIFNRLDRIHLLRSLAETDPITGLANRRRSTHDLNRYLHLSQRHCQPFCLALIALDCFQSINNQYGYTVGEQVIRQFSQILQHQFRDEDIVAHWGGEEFLVGLYASNRVDGQKRMIELLKSVEKTVFPIINYVEIQLTVSVGISTYPEDGTDLLSLYTASNAALYQAKATGGNRCLTTSRVSRSM
ncbi:response regulator [Lyngbya sp. PCC 8106]|uniref:response regulator n=1 Tax=Lyngbya sp. (strain PCC 8106) TaxID=313612 RepID=UPI0000EA8A43|nr:response regulator [Lyngbya sp. PCC 8106]EAW37254.1 two-component response regulator [Lyngbya sp. PCC 8106]